MEKEKVAALIIALMDTLEWLETGFINGVGYDEDSVKDEIRRVLHEVNSLPTTSDEEEE